jgi:hypothetical protein
MGSSPSEFIISPVKASLSHAAQALTREHSPDLLEFNPREIARACRNHAGMRIGTADTPMVGLCLFNYLELSIPVGSRGAMDRVRVVYLGNLVMHPDFRRRGLGARLAQATIGLSYAVSYTKKYKFFPDVVAIAFADADGSIKLQTSVGGVQVEQNSFAIGCHRTLDAVDRYAWKNRERVGVSRPHSIQILDMEKMLEIADWMVPAFLGGYFDRTHGSRIVIRDTSEGRSGILRELYRLYERETSGLVRLGLLDAHDRKSA